MTRDDKSALRVEQARFKGNNALMKAMIGWLWLAACTTPMIGSAQTRTAPGAASLKVTSSAFSDGGKIPRKYTCDDSNVSPPLHVENLPKAVKSLALIVDDPDAPGRTWTHWLLWNIDPKATEIRENSAPLNAVQGTSDFGSARYGGPCPPSGSHRYYFKAYALDATLSLPSSAKKIALEKAMAGHIIAQGSLMGTFSRQP
jgi:Raf kinase inhibitor-like YbhB/YbcL family protein